MHLRRVFGAPLLAILIMGTLPALPTLARPVGHLTDAAKDAAVYADGYYVGTVDDFNGTFQRLNLEAGAHHVEVVPPGQQPIAFDVNVRPGQTITYRAN